VSTISINHTNKICFWLTEITKAITDYFNMEQKKKCFKQIIRQQGSIELLRINLVSLLATNVRYY